ncbi:thioredoxin [Halorientalis salina]|uniref:thioredoxin n=1 Tax=Halorientalis salina TaxID=2932266 RepID=UPI0010AB97B5|nr:thioredoxin [Halorientalis salina]
MSEADELDEIREQKAEELREQADGGVAVAPDEPIHVEGADHFEDLLSEYDVVFVDFYADWCGPCKMLEPTVEALAAETEAAIAKVDVDQHQGLASQFQVQGVPTMILFADGEAVEQVVGVRDEDSLAQLIAQHA